MDGARLEDRTAITEQMFRCARVWRIAVRRVLEAGIEPRREGGTPNRRRAAR
jgi:hypothetical protein